MFIKTNVLPPLILVIFSLKKGFMGINYQKNAVSLYGDCNGTIDMHFILLVYKYEYIMNKSSYFVDVLMLCGIFQYGRVKDSKLFFYSSDNSRFKRFELLLGQTPSTIGVTL